MGFRRLISTLCVLIIIGVASGCSSTAPAPPETKPGLSLLIMADGEVLLKREGWAGFHPTSFGAMIKRGDQLQPAADARVMVLCENLTIWPVPSGLRSGLNNGCPQVLEPALVSAGGLITNTRGGTDPLIPYIVSPRATKLLDPHPTLRWNAVPGVATYTVQISGTDWQEQVESTEIEYPGTPALQPGMDYLLVIEADNGTSSREEGLPDLGFSLLSREEADRLRADASQIDALKLAAEAESYALAQLYAGHGVYAEAIELLEQSADANPQAANVHRALGEIYQQLGLFIEAESAYSDAVKIADSIGDLESGTTARARLGDIYLALGNKKEAHTWFNQAHEGYKRLGDSQRAAEIEALITELNN